MKTFLELVLFGFLFITVIINALGFFNGMSLGHHKMSPEYPRVIDYWAMPGTELGHLLLYPHFAED